MPTERTSAYGGIDGNAVRHEWMIDDEVVFLNHGSFGATPRCVLAEQMKWRDRLEREPVHFLVREMPGFLDEARTRCASFLHCDVEGLVFVPNATYAVNHVVKSLPICAGDEILVTNQVYPAVINTMERLAKRRGARVVVQAVPFPESGDDDERMAEAFLNGITARTKFAVIEHIASATGLVMPIKRVVDGCRERGVPCLVDAAHGPGMYGIDLEELKPDFWTGNYHKWVCAPKVSGGMFVCEEFRDKVKPVITSNFAGEGYLKEFMWIGTHDPTPFLATPAAIDFLGGFGWENVHRHNNDLVRYGLRVVSERVGTTPPIYDSEKYFGSMALVSLPEQFPIHSLDDADAVRTAFFERTKIETTFIWWNERAWIRLSAQLYNVEEDYDRLAAALEGYK